MKLDTAGDMLEHYASRAALRLLQLMSMLMGSIGWGLSKAGPTIMHHSRKAQDFAEKRLGVYTPPVKEGGDGLPSDSDKSHIQEAPEVSQPDIPEASVSEEHPDTEAKQSIQINQLSTDSGQEESSEDTSGVQTTEKAEPSSDDEDGSMPRPTKNNTDEVSSG